MANTMTASWGGLGCGSWRNVAMCVSTIMFVGAGGIPTSRPSLASTRRERPARLAGSWTASGQVAAAEGQLPRGPSLIVCRSLWHRTCSGGAEQCYPERAITVLYNGEIVEVLQKA